MKVYTAAFEGLNLILTEIESDISRGLPSFTIVGLGDTSIKEARERIRAALKKNGYVFPLQKKVVNLSPADIKKQGSHFDLPIALSMLYASGQIPELINSGIFCAGEMMLSGALRRIAGVLPLTHFAKSMGFNNIFIPYGNRKEASLIKGIKIYPIRHIKQVTEHLSGKSQVEPYSKRKKDTDFIYTRDIDFSDICGHEIPKRALEIAASGGHHMLLIGPPGTGKTMLAKACQGILPELSEEESIEVSMIYSITSNRHKQTLPIRARPFRHVHHSTTSITLLGGGNPVSFGEATLAHKGVLFLDEFAEFQHSIIEELREPLQEGIIKLGRYGKTISLPASFQLIASMNPCPCGYFGDRRKNCQCTNYQIKQYYKKISGPILDRIDLIVEVPRLPKRKIPLDEKSEKSQEIQKRIIKARQIQQKRGIMNNQIMIKDIKDICLLDKQAEAFVKTVMEKMDISPRSYLSILRVARTIADIEKSECVDKKHIAESVQYKKNFIY